VANTTVLVLTIVLSGQWWVPTLAALAVSAVKVVSLVTVARLPSDLPVGAA
jgi:hypothetical protein